MLKHRWLVVLLAVVVALGAAACGDDGDDDLDVGADDGTEAGAEEQDFEEGTTMAEVREEGTITVGTKFDQPLFGLVDPRTGEPQGFDVEIAELIVDRIGEDVEIEWVETPSAIRETAIQDGTVDMVVATYTINDTRKEVIDFAGPYYVAGQDIMVPAGNPDGVEGVDDLSGLRVCSVQGSTSVQNLREMVPDAQIVEYGVYSQCADDLRNDRVDAVSTDNVILAGLVLESDGAFELVGNPFTEEPYGIGVPKGDDEFRAFINDTLEEIYESGEWAEAYEATVGQVNPEIPEPPEVDRY